MSLRVPGYQQQVDTVGRPNQGGPRLINPDYGQANALRQGFNGIANELEQVPKMGEAVAGGELKGLRARQKLLDDAAKEASSMAEAGSTLEFNRRIQARLNGDSAAGTKGFLTTQGLAASEQSSQVLTDFEKDRSEVAEATSDLDARQRFLLRSSEALLAYRKQVETHVSKEWDGAKVATLNALEGQSIAMAESGIADMDTYSTLTKQTEQLLRENVPGAVGDAAVAEFRSKTAAALIGGKLASGDVDGATQLAHVLRPELGSRFIETKREVDRANVGRKADLKDAAITKQVEEWALSARNKDSYVTENDLRAKAGAIGGRSIAVPEEQREAYEQAIAKKVKEENARLKNDIGEHQKVAERADLDDMPVPGASVEFLTEYDPHFLRGLRAQRRARINSDRIARSGNAGDKADARRAQEAIDLEASRLYAAELYENPDADPDEFLHGFVSDKAAEGRDVYVTDAARAGLVRDGAKKVAGAEKEEAGTDKSVAGGLKETISKSGPKNADPAQQKEALGAALLLYRMHVAGNGGKPLSAEQISSLNADVARLVRTKAISRTPAPPPPGPAPSKRRPTITLENGQKARLSEDGKTWEPIK